MDYSEILLFHIIAGSIGLLLGVGAIILRKGRRWHKRVGRAFVLIMILMAASGAALAIMKPQIIFVLIAGLTAYLVTTGWTSARRSENQLGLLEPVALAGVVLLGAVSFLVGTGAIAAGQAREFPPPELSSLYFSIAGEALVFGLLDLSVILRGGLSGRQRIARHLWRMCFGLFFGAFALFVANPQVFPEPMYQSGITLAPLILILVVMVFWLLRVLFTGWYSLKKSA
ncbi:MAG: hypothetical protein HKN14_11135 [Marinicaulis sp.]|nr:hypothetical protein [Marinicaulis sp.]